MHNKKILIILTLFHVASDDGSFNLIHQWWNSSKKQYFQSKKFIEQSWNRINNATPKTKVILGLGIGALAIG